MAKATNLKGENRTMKSRARTLAVKLAIVLLIGSGPTALGGWLEYAGNPVYSPGKAYYPSIVLDGGTYEMWSTKSGGIQYATSPDGLNWTTSPSSVSGLTSPHHVLAEKYADFAGCNSGTNPSSATMSYRMWYWHSGHLYSIADVRYAESPDGLAWHNDQPISQVGTTVIDNSSSGNWNRGSYGPCDVLYDPSGSATLVEPVDEASVWANKFVMYYDGTTGGTESIGLAVSNDGRNWSGYNGGAVPVLAGTGNSGDWDRTYVSRSTTIRESDDLYHMWYSGGDGRMDHGIGYAASDDGIHWTRDGANPIFHKDDGVPWRANRTYAPVVIGDHMWFTGKSNSGVYAVGHAVPDVQPPVADADGPYRILIGEGVTLDGSGSEGTIDSYDWLVNDKTAGTGEFLDLTWLDLCELEVCGNGDYDVTLTVTGPGGEHSDTTTLTVVPEPATLTLLGGALAALAARRRRRRATREEAR